MSTSVKTENDVTDKDFIASKLNKDHINTAISAVNTAPPTTDLIPSQKNGDESHNSTDWVASDELDKAYTDLATARKNADIRAIEQALEKIYRCKKPDEGSVVPQFTQPIVPTPNKQLISIPAGSFGTDKVPSKEGSSRPVFGASSFGTITLANNNSTTTTPTFGGFKNVEMNNNTKLPNPVTDDVPPVTNSTESVAVTQSASSISPQSAQSTLPNDKPIFTGSPTADNSSLVKTDPMVRPIVPFPKMTRQDVPKFQLVTTVHKQAPDEEVFESAIGFIHAIERVAHAFGYLIEEEWKKVVPCAFAKVDRYWLENTLLKVTTWTEAKEAIMNHPESRICQQHYIKLLSSMKMAKKETVAEYHERFVTVMRNATCPDDVISAMLFHEGLSPRMKSVLKSMGVTKFDSVNHVAELARNGELILAQMDSSKKRSSPDTPVEEKPAKAQKQSVQYFCKQHGKNHTHNTEDCMSLSKTKRRKALMSNPLALKTPVFIDGKKMIARCCPDLIGGSYMTLITAKKNHIEIEKDHPEEIRQGHRVVGKTKPLLLIYPNNVLFSEPFDVCDTGYSDSDVVLGPHTLAKMGIRLEGLILKDDGTSFERTDLKNLGLDVFM